MTDGLYQVWYKLDSHSRWEQFTGHCPYKMAQAIARSLPVSKVTKLGETPNEDEDEEN
jgi:hypothetical protein